MIEKAIKAMLRAWADCMKWFPQDPDAQVDIGAMVQVWLSGMPGVARAQVNWLRTEALVRMPEWKGIDALRQVFLRRYRMPGGIEQYDPEAGTYYLDRPAARKLLEAHAVAQLPVPERQADDEPFDVAEMAREAVAAMHNSRQVVPDLAEHNTAVSPPGVETPPLYPCPRCRGLGTLQGGGFCDCPHGTAARRPSRKADPTRRGLTPVRDIVGKVKI